MKTTKRYGKKADLALSTWVKLARAYSSFEKRSADSIKTFNLTQPQFSVIEILGHLGPQKVGVICKKMLVSGGNMTLVLDNLEKLGLTERSYSMEDRRSIDVQLTNAGIEVFNKIFKQHADHITKLMSALSESEQKTLGNLLKKLGTSLNK
jgi:MarR family 2-MHQ and catechol resistance regulon transcriptional repressor